MTLLKKDLQRIGNIKKEPPRKAVLINGFSKSGTCFLRRISILLIFCRILNCLSLLKKYMFIHQKVILKCYQAVLQHWILLLPFTQLLVKNASAPKLITNLSLLGTNYAAVTR